VENTPGTAGYIYRQSIGGTLPYYKIPYEWEEVPQPGIIRLIVLPYRDQDGDGDYTDEGDFGPGLWGNAHAEGHFSAVVLDDQWPSGDADLRLSGEASVNNGVYNYSNTGQNRTLTITTNFSTVADNGGFGIRKLAAGRDKPWTMDDPEELSWQWRIVTNGTQNWPVNNDAWHALSETT
jgi:hypothetical protein